MKSLKSLKSINLRFPSSISPAARWILTILILGVGVVLVVVLYAQEQTRNSDLRDEVETASSTLIKNSLTKNELADKLAVANLTLAELTGLFPASEYTMDVEELVFSAAADSGVELKAVSCPAPKIETVGGRNYQVFTVSIVVSGQTEDLLSFVGRVGYWLPSASIESVSISGNAMSLGLKVYA
jgi:hypothetical protein